MRRFPIYWASNPISLDDAPTPPRVKHFVYGSALLSLDLAKSMDTTIFASNSSYGFVSPTNMSWLCRDFPLYKLFWSRLITDWLQQCTFIAGTDFGHLEYLPRLLSQSASSVAWFNVMNSNSTVSPTMQVYFTDLHKTATSLSTNISTNGPCTVKVRDTLGI